MSYKLPSVPNTNLKLKGQLNSAPVITTTVDQLCKKQGVVPRLPRLSWKDDSEWAIKMKSINEKITELCEIYNETIDSNKHTIAKNKILLECESMAKDLMDERNKLFRASYLALCDEAKNYIPSPSFQKGGTHTKKRHTVHKRSKKYE